MRIIFDQRLGVWKVATENRIHPIKTNDFLVLAGLTDRTDRKFHNISELTSTSKLNSKIFERSLKNLEATVLINCKKNSYRISKIGENVVQRIRSDNVEMIGLEAVKRLVEAR